MREHIRPKNTGLMAITLCLCLPAVWAEERGSLDGSGTSTVSTVGASHEAVVATFRDFLSDRVARQVDSVFRDLLDRPVDAASLFSYLPLIESDGGAALVDAVLDSDECLRTLVSNWYEDFLSRSPSSAETDALIDRLRSGERDEAMLATILSSQEYYTRRGGSTNDGFLNAVFDDLLGREIDDASSERFSVLLAFGGTRAQVVNAITSTREYRSRVIGGYFERFLGRTAASTEVSALVGQIQSGARFEDVIAQIAGSEEYFAQVDAPQYTASVAWGDGQSTAAETLANPLGGFEVRGTHQYAQWGNFAIRTTITDGAGSTLVLDSIAVVLPPANNNSNGGDAPRPPAPGNGSGGNPPTSDGNAGGSNGNPQPPAPIDNFLDALGPDSCGLGAGVFTPLMLSGLLLMRRTRSPLAAQRG